MRRISLLIFILLLGVSIFSCQNEGTQAVNGDDDLDNSNSEIDSLPPEQITCNEFCAKSYQCDTTGAFTSSELDECKTICQNLKETCVTETLLACANKDRCDEFNTCVIEREQDTDCQFPVDGDAESEMGLQPVMKLPTSVGFGAVVVGSSAKNALSIVNSGALVLEVYDISIDDSGAEFVADYVKGTVLKVRPNEELKVDVTYSPIDSGNDVAKVNVFSNDPDLRVGSVILESEYKGTANIAVKPENIDFGVWSVGARSDVGKVTITNNPGKIDDNRMLQITSLKIEQKAEGFFILAPDTPEVPFFIAPDQTVTIDTYFTPQGHGASTDNLIIESDTFDEKDKTIKVELKGIGAARELCVIPSPVFFGSVKVGEKATKPLIFEPCGESPVTLKSIALDSTGSVFELNKLPSIPAEGKVIEVGDSIEAEIVYTPGSVGTDQTILTIVSDDLFAPTKKVEISGQGAVSDMSVSPSVLLFEDVKLGSKKELLLTIRNKGTWPLEVTNALFESGKTLFKFFADDKETPIKFPVKLEGGGGKTIFHVIFEPAQEGAVVDTLTLESDNSSGGVSVGLAARGTASKISISPDAPYDFGIVQVDGNSDIHITVTNNGRAPLNISKLGIKAKTRSGNRAEEDAFSVAPSAITDAIPWNGKVDLTLSYSPTAVGDDEAIFYIESDNTEIAKQKIEMGIKGTATDPVITVSEQFPYNFGQVYVGAQKGPVSIELTNTGDGPLLIESITPDSGFDEAFTALVSDSTFPVLLRPASSSSDKLTVLISFAPNTADFFLGHLVVSSNDATTPSLDMVMQGTGANCPANQYDCDDNPADCETHCEINGDGTELCNGVDDNCNCSVDEGFNINQACPAVGDCIAGVTECHPDGSGTIICSTSHKDGSDYRGSDEVCDNRDNDCDDSIDEDFFVGDECFGKGECGKGTLECKDYSSTRCSTDIGGKDYPENPPEEKCDLKDNDCDGKTDEIFNTGSECTGVGECLDGVWECDTETTIRCSTGIGGSNYDISDPQKQGSNETCDGKDNNCNGYTDEDWQIGYACEGEGECGLGFWECKGTDDRKCSTNPGGSKDQSENERCDDKDNNCDGKTDENWNIGDECNGIGLCGKGMLECKTVNSSICSTHIGGSGYPDRPPSEMIEICDSEDNDCDGSIDENYGIGRECEGVGECGAGHFECDGNYASRCDTDIGGSKYDDVNHDELCDGKDNDCNGLTDEDHSVGTQCDGEGECGAGFVECHPSDTSDTVCSTDPLGSNSQDIPETCDGKDNDCDGETDESCKTSLVRFVKEVVANTDYYHRLAPAASPPAGFTPDSVGAICSVYSELRPGLVNYYELTDSVTTDTIYTSSTSTRDTKVGQGWASTVIGYVSEIEIDGSIPLYSMNKTTWSDHTYIIVTGNLLTDPQYISLSNQGYELSGLPVFVWSPSN